MTFEACPGPVRIAMPPRPLPKRPLQGRQPPRSPDETRERHAQRREVLTAAWLRLRDRFLVWLAVLVVAASLLALRTAT